MIGQLTPWLMNTIVEWIASHLDTYNKSSVVRMWEDYKKESGNGVSYGDFLACYFLVVHSPPHM